MSTLRDRPHTALVVIDFQVGVVAEAHERDAVVGNISSLVDKARSEHVPVIWVQHSDEDMPQGTPDWEYVPELAIGESEAVVHKSYGDSFEGTDFEDVLAKAGIGHLIVAGAETDACVRSTIHGAFTRGYDVTLVSDAHTTNDSSPWGAPKPADVIAHTNLYWRYHDGPGRKAAVTETKSVVFGG